MLRVKSVRISLYIETNKGDYSEDFEQGDDETLEELFKRAEEKCGEVASEGF